MFDRIQDYPMAVANSDDDGVDAAIDWCLEHLEEGETLSVWTAQFSNLSNNPTLERLVNRYSNVEHVTGRGGATVRSAGPILMAWPEMDDIGKLLRRGGHRIRALCVIAWDEDQLRPWVESAKPTVLGNSPAWGDMTDGIDPVVREALRSLTSTLNHNNTISAGFEKDHVVSVLLALREAGYTMDGAVMQGWALANGWSGKNPQRLAKYVDDINAGKRPRCRSVVRSDYVETLKGRLAEPS